MRVLDYLLRVREDSGAGFLLLLDPDRVPTERLTATAEAARTYGVDAILVGGSMMICDDFDARMAQIKRAASVPVILFPGNAHQITPNADAVLFLSLISGRNPNYLIESGSVTSVQYVSGTVPIPRDKTDIAMAHALAAQYMGMKLVYLEAGSGADYPVPEEMVAAVADYCRLPVIVGGGIRHPEDARARVKAGAAFVVVGTRLEYEKDFHYMAEMAEAVHVAAKTMI